MTDLGILLVTIVSPFVVYFAVKLGTVAFFRGRQFFNDSIEREKDNDKD